MQVQKRILAAHTTAFWLAFLIVATGIGSPVSATEATIEMQPALLSHPSLSLESLLLKATTITTKASVLCETLITAQGRFSRTACYNSTPRNTAYENTVLRTITFARATPAVVAGKKILVWLQFGVHYDPSGASLLVVVHPEANLDAVDLDYVGPQRYRRPRNCPWVGIEPRYVQYVVDTSGLAKIERVRTINRTLDVTESYQRCYKRARFIPASRSGTPVISRVLEAHFRLRHLIL